MKDSEKNRANSDKLSSALPPSSHSCLIITQCGRLVLLFLVLPGRQCIPCGYRAQYAIVIGNSSAIAQSGQTDETFYDRHSGKVSWRRHILKVSQDGAMCK